MVRLLINIVLVACLASSVSAQMIDPKINVLKDSVMLGEEFDVAISVVYPKDKQIIFADSNHFFGTVEYVKKVYTDTKSNDSLSVDSAVFTFSTFDLAPVQKIAFPVYLVTKGDSIEIVSDSVSVFLKEIIQELPDQIELKGNTELNQLDYEFDKRPWLIAGGVILVVILVGFFLFGKKIVNRYRSWILNKRHTQFKVDFEVLVQGMEGDKTKIESLLSLWKDHLTLLTGEPFNTFSTLDIFKKTKNEQLRDDLKVMDQLIYSSKYLESISDLTSSLLSFTEIEFEKKIKGLKNA